ncbi:Syntaxin-like protein psy1 [Choanephora cucurbitarum]|uniref:Syntaxin-like protein psy1 n=1 Tax=Choanephora cucurbitarum TaxID=101091 RepID=A0A1C7NFE3_9FUNG|nr:Syntaxin-like protein psy1 [Choanephora cucurbitarum]
MSNYNSRYNVSRDRLADLRGSLDSSDAFGGPTRTTGISSRYQTETANESYELQSRQYEPIGPTAQTDINTMEGFLAEIDAISNSIKQVQNNVDLISNLHDASLVSINEQQWKQNSSQLAQLVNDTSVTNKHLRDRIKALEASNARHPKNSDLNIRKAQVSRVKKEFMNSLTRYKDVEANYNQKYRQRVERQIRIVKQDVTEEELDAIIDSDQQNQIFAQSLLRNNRSGQAKSVLSEVQTRHEDIKRIQATIIELAQLFEDMQMMIEEQGQVLDQVDNHAQETTQDLEHGNKQISRAIVLARSTRAKKWCCFFITIIICVVIAILVWWFAFDHPGVGHNNNNNQTA